MKHPKQFEFSCVIGSTLSDHYPFFFAILWTSEHHENIKFVQVYNPNSAALRHFYEELSVRIQDLALNLDLFTDPNDKYELFESIVVDIKSKYLSPKLVIYNQKVQR